MLSDDGKLGNAASLHITKYSVFLEVLMSFKVIIRGSPFAGRLEVNDTLKVLTT